MKRKEHTPEEQLAAARIPDSEAPYELPEGWTWVRLGGVTCNHGQKKPEKEFTYIDIGSIDNVHQQLGSLENRLKPQDAPSRARKIVHEGDILYSTVRPYLHNMCRVTQKIEPEPIASTGFAVLSPNEEINGAFLFEYLRSSMFDQYANNPLNSRGINYPAIQEKVLLRAPIPLPPLAEQHRIVRRIEALYQKLDAAEEKLNAVEASFVTRKNALLQKAFSGMLTREWRQKNGFSEEHEGNEKIPSSWNWKSLGKVAKWGSGGTPLRRESSYYHGDILWIKSGELKEKYISDTEEKITQKALKESSAKIFPIHTVVIAMYGATIGQVAIMAKEASTNQACACAVCSEELFYEYLYYFLVSQKDAFTLLGRGGAQPNISQMILKKYSIPLPPFAEQREIVRRLDALLSREAKARAAVAAARQQLQTLRTTLLAHAFRGRL